VKAAQHVPTAQAESSVQGTLAALAVLLTQALLLTVLRQFHVLITPLTLKPTPLNQTGAQT
jgi:hypothetical protein